MNELNPTNAFGELLLDLIEQQYAGDYDAGIQALVQSTGLSEDEVVSIVQGDTIVEDESLLADIITAFPNADDQDIEVIVNVATGVDEEDRDALMSEIEANEGMGDMPMNEEVAEGEVPAGASYGYAYNPYLQASFAAAAQASNEVADLRNQIASFQAEQYLTNELKDLDRVTGQYVASELLPPSYKAMLIGNFSDDTQRMARFSRMAAENGVDLPTMLFATKYALGMLMDASDFVEFRDFSVTDEQVATANFSASLDSIVQSDLDAIFGN